MKAYLRISLIYFFIGCLWILLSDHVVEALARGDTKLLSFLQTIKGWFFVLISTLVIFLLTRQAWQKHVQATKEKREVFKRTVAGAFHILLNYLNKMQLLTLEAERSQDFDKELLASAIRNSQEATRELRDLEHLDFQCPSDIEDYVYRQLRHMQNGDTGR